MRGRSNSDGGEVVTGTLAGRARTGRRGQDEHGVRGVVLG